MGSPPIQSAPGQAARALPSPGARAAEPLWRDARASWLSVEVKRRSASGEWAKSPIDATGIQGQDGDMSMAARTGMLYEPRRTPRRAPVSAVQAIISRDRERALREELSTLRRELAIGAELPNGTERALRIAAVRSSTRR
jgi:hypothetical protein